MRRVDRLIGSSDSLRRLSAALAQHRALLEAVAGLLPADVAAHCVAATLTGSELRLLVDSPAWATRLRYLARDLQRGLRNRWRVETVTVGVEPIRGATAGRPIRRARLSAAAATAIASAAAGIEDEGLRQALLRLSRLGGR